MHFGIQKCIKRTNWHLDLLVAFLFAKMIFTKFSGFSWNKKKLINLIEITILDKVNTVSSVCIMKGKIVETLRQTSHPVF